MAAGWGGCGGGGAGPWGRLLAAAGAGGRAAGAAGARRGGSAAAGARAPAGGGGAAAGGPAGACGAPGAPGSRLRRRAGVVCTIGPASEPRPVLARLLAAGMDVMRCNFSHGQYDEQGARVDSLRALEAAAWGAAPAGRGLPAKLQRAVHAVGVDLKGPEVRIGQFAAGAGRKLDLAAGADFALFSDPALRTEGTAAGVWVDYPLHEVLQPGQQVFVNDGQVALEVLACEAGGGGAVRCRVLNGARLGERKGVNVPGAELPGLPVMTDYDRSVLEWAVKRGAHAVFASFVRRAADVHEMRAFVDARLAERTAEEAAELPGGAGRAPLIFSKIESVQGLQNFEEILAASDGIMVARGDLGVEIPMEEVPVAQKRMIARCRQAGKPAICATQMMESMEESPRPTRAEVADVANAVFDGATAVMLSGETGNGSFPAETVAAMARIAARAEDALAFGEVEPAGVVAPGEGPEEEGVGEDPREALLDAVAAAAAHATPLGGALVVPALSGGFARRVAAVGGLPQPFLCPTLDPHVAAQLLFSAGAQPLLVTDAAGRPLGAGRRAELLEELGKPALERALARLAVQEASSLGWIPAEGPVTATVASEEGGAAPVLLHLDAAEAPTAADRALWAAATGLCTAAQ